MFLPIKHMCNIFEVGRKTFDGKCNKNRIQITVDKYLVKINLVKINS